MQRRQRRECKEKITFIKERGVECQAILVPGRYAILICGINTCSRTPFMKLSGDVAWPF